MLEPYETFQFLRHCTGARAGYGWRKLTNASVLGESAYPRNGTGRSVDGRSEFRPRHQEYVLVYQGFPEQGTVLFFRGTVLARVKVIC